MLNISFKYGGLHRNLRFGSGLELILIKKYIHFEKRNLLNIFNYVFSSRR